MLSGMRGGFLRARFLKVLTVRRQSAAAAEGGEGGAEGDESDGCWFRNGGAEGEADHVVGGDGVGADEGGAAGAQVEFEELVGEGVDGEGDAVFGAGGDVEDG